MVRAMLTLSILLALVGTALPACAQGELWVDRVEEGGRLLVPLRGVLESFGAVVNWDGRLQEIEISCSGNRILMYVNDYDAYINGTLYRLDVPPRVIRGSTHVPLRFVGEATGGTVDYRGSYVDITDPSGYLVRVHLAGGRQSGGGGTTGGGGYIASWTSQRSVHDADLRGYSNWQLTLMRNEIYARHGRPFDNPTIRAHFMSQGWYSPNSNYRESWLTRLESNNAAAIASYQKRVYGTPATRP